MIFKSNELIKYENYIVRIVYVDYVDKFMFIVNIKDNKWPYAVPINKIEEDLEQGRAVIVEDTLLSKISGYSLNEIEREKRDFAWQVVSYILSKCYGANIFISKCRTKVIKETIKEYNISYNTAKSYLLRYYKNGQTRMGLVPLYNNCGGRNKEKAVSEKKRGRPSAVKGININQDIKKMFKVGLNRYYYNERMNSLKLVYELIIRDNFVKEYVIENGEKIPILKERSEIPTYNQFLYWFKQFNNLQKEVIKRQGERFYHQNHRAIIGTPLQEIQELGSNGLWLIDSTILDCYLVSSLNKNEIVSRGVLYLVVDVFSSLIVSAYVTLESFNSYSGAMMALYYAMTSKKNYCERFGIHISEEDWPSAIPQVILADRGEIVNSQIESAIQNMGISVQNTAPYHAEAKSQVEKMFDIINKGFKPFVDGVVVNGINKVNRGGTDYRILANLSIEEMSKIILKLVIFYNKYHVLSNDISRHTLVDENMERIPIKMWEYGVQKKGIIRTLPPEVILINLLPSKMARVGAKGVALGGLFYVSDYTLTNNWHSTGRKKSWEIKVSYNPLDLSEIYFVEDDRKTFHVLKLVDHLKKFNGKSEYDVEDYFKKHKELNEKAKENELKNKVKLFNEIEEIVENARRTADIQRDETLSKRQRLRGITENNRKERELHKEKLFSSNQEEEELEIDLSENEEVNVEDLNDFDVNELDIFNEISKEYGGDIYE